MDHFDDLGGLIRACPVPAPILGLVEPALITRWVCQQDTDQQFLHSWQTCPRLAWAQGEGLQEKPAAGGASPGGSEARQERARHPSFPRGTRGAAGLAEGTSTGQPGPVSPLPLVPSGHLHEHHIPPQRFGGGRHNCRAWPGLSAPVAGQKRGRLGPVAPVTSAKDLLSHCHHPRAEGAASPPIAPIALSGLLLLSQADLFLTNPDCSALKTS